SSRDIHYAAEQPLRQCPRGLRRWRQGQLERRLAIRPFVNEPCASAYGHDCPTQCRVADAVGLAGDILPLQLIANAGEARALEQIGDLFGAMLSDRCLLEHSLAAREQRGRSVARDRKLRGAALPNE